MYTGRYKHFIYENIRNNIIINLYNLTWYYHDIKDLVLIWNIVKSSEVQV